MKRARLAIALLLVVWASVPSRAQTPGAAPRDVPGRAVEAYEIRHGFILTVTRDADGRVREMLVTKTAIAGGEPAAGAFTPQLASQLVDELAPPIRRGGERPVSGLVQCFSSCVEMRVFANVAVDTWYRDADPSMEVTRLELHWR